MLIINHCMFADNPIMIVTEYMENGALDAFLRVSHFMIMAYYRN